MIQDKTVIPAMIAAYIQITLFLLSATPWLIICARKDGRSICPTAENSTRRNKPEICFGFNFTFENIIFIIAASPFLLLNRLAFHNFDSGQFKKQFSKSVFL